MEAVLEGQMEVKAWRSGIEDRLERLEAITGLIPDILERLPAPNITPAHQNKVKYYSARLQKMCRADKIMSLRMIAVIKDCLRI